MTETNELIQRRQPLRDSPIWESQAKLTARVIQETATAYEHLWADGRGTLLEGLNSPWEKIGAAIFDEPEYQFLIETIYACGWVCNDLQASDFLPQVNRDVEGTVGVWGLPLLRLYLHTLMRGEKWCDGDSSVVLDAFASGALQAVARRLESDASLYEPL